MLGLRNKVHRSVLARVYVTSPELAKSASEHWFSFGAMLNFFAMQFFKPQDRKGTRALSDRPDSPLRYVFAHPLAQGRSNAAFGLLT